jgi:hypothetical protein
LTSHFSTVRIGSAPLNSFTGVGAPFSQLFNVLPGDYNDDGGVNSVDTFGVYSKTFHSYNILADVVDMNDVRLVRSLFGTTFP